MNLPSDGDQRAIVLSFIEFMSSRGKGKGCMLSTEELAKLTGQGRLELKDHDIYVMGKTKNNDTLWSKIRIESNTTAENNIQGKLGVRYLDGYAKTKAGSDDLTVTFAEGIRRFTTEDTVGFKHRSAFFLCGKFYRLMHVEHLCNINVMCGSDQRKFQSSISIKKAQSYSMQRAMKKEWAHVSRDRCVKDQRKKMLKMMIPYWMNCSDFYEAFTKDILEACEEARVSLGPVEPGMPPSSQTSATLPCFMDDSNWKKRSRPAEEASVLPRKKNTQQGGLVVW